MNSSPENTPSTIPLARERLTTFVPGIGEVPRGPRRSFSAFRISSGRLQRANTSSNALVRIKEEDTEPDWSSDSAVEEGKVPQDGDVKREVSSEPVGSSEFDLDYQNRFSRLLAESQRNSRSDTTGSRRQDTREGRWSRSDRLASFRASHRSRSPRHSGNSNSTSSRSSSMFYPDSWTRTDLYPDTHIPEYSILRRRAPVPATEIPGRPPFPQPSSASQEPSSPPSLTTSASPPLPSSPSSARLVSSSTEPSPPAEPTEEEVARCQCPIGPSCTVRSGNHLDCRPLVREYTALKERRDEEAFEIHRETPSTGPKSTTDANLVKIINRLNQFVVANTPATRERAVQQIRAWILEMEDVDIAAGTQQTITTQQVVPALTSFLAPVNAAIRRQKSLPAYIEEELTVLERKWGKGDFSGAIKRGLIEVTTYDVNGFPKSVRYQVNPNWPFYVSALYFGAGQLVNGQIWESRVELQRDGVHAPRIAGISGTIREGARSIVLGAFDEKNNLGYADIDMGEYIEYVGTALRDQDGLGPTTDKDPHMGIPNAWDQNSAVKPTTATQAMFKSMETKEPVRVIRSWKMCEIVKNKPIKGYRYNGLYEVIGATALKEARQIWSFRLRRLPENLPEQGPLRGHVSRAQRLNARQRRIGHFHK